MKNLMLLTFSIAFCFQGMASTNNFCDSAYEAKMNRIDDKYVMRSIGGFVTSASIGYVALVSGMGLPALAFGAVGGSVGLLTTLGTGAVVLHYVNDEDKLSNRFLPAINLDREKGLRAAINLFRILDQSKDELKTDAFERYQQVNPNVLYENFTHVTLMDVMLKKVNRKRSRRNKDKLSYDELREKISELSKSDAFCPMIAGKNRPRTILQIKKIIDKEI
jgi:hypothetical protein